MPRYSPTKLCDGAQMTIFGDFFASCVFSEPSAASFRKKNKKNKPRHENIMVCPIPWGDHNNCN